MAFSVAKQKKYQFNDKVLDDIPGLTPEQIKKYYSQQYPELLNAKIYGPEIKEEVAYYTFETKAGENG